VTVTVTDHQTVESGIVQRIADPRESEGGAEPWRGAVLAIAHDDCSCMRENDAGAGRGVSASKGTAAASSGCPQPCGIAGFGGLTRRDPDGEDCGSGSVDEPGPGHSLEKGVDAAARCRSDDK